MACFDWPSGPGWVPLRFEMRIVPAVLLSTSPYGRSTQALDLLSERWWITLALPPDTGRDLGAAREAFADRLEGQVNLVAIGHQQRRLPLGTLRDGAAVDWVNAAAATVGWTNAAGLPTRWTAQRALLAAPVAQLANTAAVRTTAYATLRAGDQLRIGLVGEPGQLVRVMADAVADAAGLMAIEFAPRARAAFSAGTGLVSDGPTAQFRLAADGLAVDWRPGMVDGATLELVEAV